MTRLMEDILKEPRELQRTLAYTFGEGKSALDHAVALVQKAANVYITGIGSSWHAGMAVESMLRSGCRPAVLVDASELLHFVPIAPDSVLIVLSRSGKSVEVVRLLAEAKNSKTRVIAITNTPASPLGRQADVVLRLEAAFDHLISIRMYSALVLAGGILASIAVGASEASLELELTRVLSETEESLERWSRQVETSDWFSPDVPTYFLARGGSLASCHEARLLWEEAAKSPATAMTTGGFRHGPQEIVTLGRRIGLWIDAEQMRFQDLSLAQELRDLGCRVMVVGHNVSAGAGDLVFSLPSSPSRWQFLIDVIPAQLSAERLSRLRGVDCDSFRLCPYIIEAEEGLGAR